MAGMTVVGVFGSVGTAEAARAALLQRGVPVHRITISVPLTDDAIAAEAPGQSYVNQSYASSATDTERARYNEAVRTGACLLSVASERGEAGRDIRALMQQQGARITMARPPDDPVRPGG